MLILIWPLAISVSHLSFIIYHLSVWIGSYIPPTKHHTAGSRSHLVVNRPYDRRAIAHGKALTSAREQNQNNVRTIVLVTWSFCYQEEVNRSWNFSSTFRSQSENPVKTKSQTKKSYLGYLENSQDFHHGVSRVFMRRWTV